MRKASWRYSWGSFFSERLLGLRHICRPSKISEPRRRALSQVWKRCRRRRSRCCGWVRHLKRWILLGSYSLCRPFFYSRILGAKKRCWNSLATKGRRQAFMPQGRGAWRTPLLRLMAIHARDVACLQAGDNHGVFARDAPLAARYGLTVWRAVHCGREW